MKLLSVIICFLCALTLWADAVFPVKPTTPAGLHTRRGFCCLFLCSLRLRRYSAELAPEHIADLLIAGVGGGVVRIGVEHGHQPHVCGDTGYLIHQMLGVVPPAVFRLGVHAAVSIEKSYL